MHRRRRRAPVRTNEEPEVAFPSEYTDDDFNELLEDAINYVASQFDKNNTFDDARAYAEGSCEQSGQIPDDLRNAIDQQWQKLTDSETKRAWLILEPVAGPEGVFNKGSEALVEAAGEENEEPFDLATLDALRDSWQVYFDEHAAAQMYTLEWLTPEDESEFIVLEPIDDESMFGYDGKPIYMDPDSAVADTAEALKKADNFQPNKEVQDLLDSYGLVWKEVLDWFPEGGWDGVKYIYPFGMYGGSAGMWYVVLDQDELWSLMDNSINDDEWLAEALDVSEYDDEILEAWRTILFGGNLDEVKKFAKSGGEPEEERIMGFEVAKGGGAFEFWDLKNAAAIKQHGSKMGQCVGNRQYGYVPAVERGEAKIIAMRTKAGKPKLTLEAYLDEDGNIVKFGEIKGKGNRIPGFQSHDPSKGKFKPVEVEVVMAFADEQSPPVDLSTNQDIAPALSRLEGRQLETRRNPKTVEAFSRGFEWGR